MKIKTHNSLALRFVDQDVLDLMLLNNFVYPYGKQLMYMRYEKDDNYHAFAYNFEEEILTLINFNIKRIGQKEPQWNGIDPRIDWEEME